MGHFRREQVVASYSIRLFLLLVIARKEEDLLIIFNIDMFSVNFILFFLILLFFFKNCLEVSGCHSWYWSGFS